ncbi:MAG: NADH-quinone oxidoreductase subunit NuoH [Anaerolineae bacterium]|nr:NADH-quinone oxidoreductase subunit NuoH [Thermoflexales bacterium]MDW8407050.1 NADH-quinone oxidoreductase subunit NuoH [Anaerolineae bacterium]
MNPILEAVLKSAAVLVVALTGFAYMTWIERKFIGRLQARIGPNRAGPFGLLQPVADGLKLIFKESITPANVDVLVYFLAPIVAVVPALVLFAVIPFGSDPTFQLASGINVGALYVMAVIGVGIYGMILAGWASNNKYALLGGLRASAQVISYELGLGLAVLSVIMMASSASLNDIVAYQQPGNILGWLIFRQPVAAAIFAVTALAELARAPFDLVEAEQELTAGFMTEYGGMKFALFYMSEYVKMIAMSALFVTFFLGGWSGPFVNEAPALSLVYFTVKVLVCLLVMVWVRATLPRIRYDKLMAFGWKVLLPVGLLNVVITAFLIAAGVPGYK